MRNGKGKNQKDAVFYKTTRINLFEEKRTVKVWRGRDKERGDHVFIQTQRLIKKEDFLNGVFNTPPSFRRKNKVVTVIGIKAEGAYALCFLLAETLGLKLDGFLEDSEVQKILLENAQIEDFQNERRRNLK